MSHAGSGGVGFLFSITPTKWDIWSNETYDEFCMNKFSCSKITRRHDGQNSKHKWGRILSTAETSLNNETFPDVTKRSPFLRVERLLVIDNIAITDLQIIIAPSQTGESIFWFLRPSLRYRANRIRICGSNTAIRPIRNYTWSLKKEKMKTHQHFYIRMYADNIIFSSIQKEYPKRL
jgi:hypothetical protein